MKRLGQGLTVKVFAGAHAPDLPIGAVGALVALDHDVAVLRPCELDER